MHLTPSVHGIKGSGSPGEQMERDRGPRGRRQVGILFEEFVVVIAVDHLHNRAGHTLGILENADHSRDIGVIVQSPLRGQFDETGIQIGVLALGDFHDDLLAVEGREVHCAKGAFAELAADLDIPLGGHARLEGLAQFAFRLGYGRITRIQSQLVHQSRYPVLAARHRSKCLIGADQDGCIRTVSEHVLEPPYHQVGRIGCRLATEGWVALIAAQLLRNQTVDMLIESLAGSPQVRSLLDKARGRSALITRARRRGIGGLVQDAQVSGNQVRQFHGLRALLWRELAQIEATGLVAKVTVAALGIFGEEPVEVFARHSNLEEERIGLSRRRRFASGRDRGAQARSGRDIGLDALREAGGSAQLILDAHQ